MKHLDEGTLQAFLDHELSPRERGEAAEHLLGCEACRTSQDELARANAVFANAVAALDTEVPDADMPAPPRTAASSGWRLGGPFIKAASLTLLVAAAASAAVPGSPVREWITQAVQPEPTPEAAVTETTPAPTVSEPAPAPVPVTVSLPMEPSMEIALSGLDGTTIRLRETEAEYVGVSSAGAEKDPVFTTGQGRIEVRDAVGGAVEIYLPLGVESARITVDGRLYAEKVNGRLRIAVEATSVDGASVWQ